VIKQELYKVFVNKSTLLFIVVLLAFNIVQLVYLDNKANPWPASAYTEAWRDIEELLEDETAGRTIVQDRLKERSLAVALARVSEDEDVKAAAAVYTGDVYTELQLLSRIQTEVDFALGYNEYLASVEEAARRYEMLAVFSEPNGYAYREIMKMQEVYGKVSEKTLEPVPSAGVRLATHSDVTDILALVLFLYLTVTVWLKEREQNMLLLLRTAKNGRVRLALCKLAVLVVSCVGAGVLLYGSNLVVAGIRYDLGDMSRPLASVFEYGHTLWEITVGEFLVIGMLFKILSYVFIMLLLSVICLCVHSSIAAFAGIIAVGAAGCLMYYNIPALSVWASLKYLNPFAVLKTEMLFEGFEGLDFFGYPIDQRLCIVVLFVVGYVAFSIIAVRLFIDYIIKGKRRLPRFFERIKGFVAALRRKLERHTSVLLHELHRILVCHGVLVVIAIAAVLIISDTRPEPVRYYSEKFYYMAQYLKKLEGPVTDEKRAFIEAEEARVERPANDTEDAQKDALRLIRERLEYLDANEGAYFIYDTPHNELTAEYSNNSDFLQAVYVMIFLVLCMPCFFAPDLQNGMYRIVEVTAKGRRSLKRLRYTLGCVLTVSFVVFLYLSKFLQLMISHEVKTEVFEYPVNSIPHLEALGAGMSVGGYYVVIHLLRLVAAVMGMLLIYRLSRWIKSPSYTMFAGIIVLMFPLLVALYSRGLIYAAYPHSMFAGNLFIQERIAAIVGVVAWVLFFVLEGIAMAVIGRRKR